MKDDLEARVVYVRDAPTRAEARRYSLPGGTEIRFPQRPAPLHRKIIIITNLGGVAAAITEIIQIRVGLESISADPPQAPLPLFIDTGGLAGTLFLRTMIGIPTSDTVWIKNNAGVTIQVDVCEIWYV